MQLRLRGAADGDRLLGNLALRLGRPIDWDPVTMKVRDTPEADALIRREYREGWEL